MSSMGTSRPAEGKARKTMAASVSSPPDPGPPVAVRPVRRDRLRDGVGAGIVVFDRADRAGSGVAVAGAKGRQCRGRHRAQGSTFVLRTPVFALGTARRAHWRTLSARAALTPTFSRERERVPRSGG